MSPEKYRWSSYNFYINTKSSELVDIKRVKSLLDMDISQYADFVHAAIDFKQQMDNNKKLVKAVSEITSKVED